MRALRLLVPCLILVAACDTQAKDQLRTLAHADSLRTDSLVKLKNDLLDEVMTSTQFVNDLNTEVSKLKSRTSAVKLSTQLSKESDLASIKEERSAVVRRISELVARLDSSESRVASLRERAARLSRHDSTLVAQVAQYEKTIADLRRTVESQKAEYETQIASLNSKVDTITRANAQLATEKTALADTVGELTNEKNTAYYVIGTKDELIKQGILVEEGRKRFLVVGGRTVAPARELDPSKFTRIDRERDRVINFPAGDYVIFSRQNPAYASPFASKGSTMSGGIRIDQPDRFWEPSRFLIIVRS